MSTLHGSQIQAGTITDDRLAVPPTVYTDEQVRDVMAVALVGGTGVTVTPNDPGDTITIAATGVTAGCGARVGRSTGLSLAHNTDTAVDFDTADFDTDTFWTSGSNTRLTVPTGKGGLYVLTASCWFNANGTGIRQVRFRKNGTDIYGWQRIAGTAAGAVIPTASAIVKVVAGDYFELMIYQDSGGSLGAGANVSALNAAILRVGS